MAAVGFSFPTIDTRSSPIFQISAFQLLSAHHFSKGLVSSTSLIFIRDWIEHLLSEIEAGSGQQPPCWMVPLSLYFTVAQL